MEISRRPAKLPPAEKMTTPAGSTHSAVFAMLSMDWLDLNICIHSTRGRVVY